MTTDTILTAVSAVFPVTIADITGPRRHRNCSEARQLVAYILYTGLRMSNRQVGEILGGRDHTTSILMRRTFLAVYASDRNYRAMADRVFTMLNITHAIAA